MPMQGPDIGEDETREVSGLRIYGAIGREVRHQVVALRVAILNVVSSTTSLPNFYGVRTEVQRRLASDSR